MVAYRVPCILDKGLSTKTGVAIVQRILTVTSYIPNKISPMLKGVGNPWWKTKEITTSSIH